MKSYRALLISFICVSIILLITESAQSAKCMDFKLIDSNEVVLDGKTFSKRRSVLADGDINDGDSQKLKDLIKDADRDFLGNITIYLNSPGGSVGEALRIVKVMDAYEVSTIIPERAVCASACASILYVSGRFHTILDGGLIGLHPCFRDGVAAPICNDVIAKNAAGHGTPYGSVEAYMQASSDKDSGTANGMVWMSKDTACYTGLCGPPSFDYTLAIPSFDCSVNLEQADQVICGDRRLARYDASIAKYYALLRKSLPSEEWEKIKAEQKDWIKSKYYCNSNYRCIIGELSFRRFALRGLYNTTIIQNLYDSLLARGFEKDVLDVAGAALNPEFANEACKEFQNIDATCENFQEFQVLRRLDCLSKDYTKNKQGTFKEAWNFVQCASFGLDDQVRSVTSDRLWRLMR
jgi:hypothetical protein